MVELSDEMPIEVTSTAAMSSHTCIESDDIKYSFKFKINNFIECKHELWSPSFNTGFNCKWILYINPNKYSKDGVEYVSAYLNLAASDRNTVSAKFKIAIIDNNNELKNLKRIDGHEFKVGDDWGWATFAKKSIISNYQNDFIDTNNNKRLTIYCEIILCETTGEEYKEIMDCNLLKEFSHMFNDKEFTDLKIIVNSQKEFLVHRAVLSSRSEVFADLIRNEDKDKSNILKIKDIEVDIFEELLRFVYTGKTFDTINDKIESLFLAALRFGIKQLKRITEEIIYQNLCFEKAVHVLLFAEENKAIELKDKLIKYMACNHPYVKRASPEEWEELIEEQPTLIMEIFDALADIYHTH